jgi:chromosome partitioning protein
MSAKILALAGEKGGPGKSTLAVSLAVVWKALGHKVLVVDADPQGSALTWANLAERHGAPTATTPRVEALTGEALYDGIAVLAEGYDVVAIDCPGRHDVTQRAALMVADLALLPVRPSVLDTSSLAGSVELVTAARDARREVSLGELAAAVVVSQRVRGTVLGARAARDVEPLGVRVLDTEVYLRITYAEAYAAGLGPTTYDPKSAAAAEVRRLALEVGRLLGLAQPPKRRGR